MTNNNQIRDLSRLHTILTDTENMDQNSRDLLVKLEQMRSWSWNQAIESLNKEPKPICPYYMVIGVKPDIRHGQMKKLVDNLWGSSKLIASWHEAGYQEDGNMLLLKSGRDKRRRLLREGKIAFLPIELPCPGCGLLTYTEDLQRDHITPKSLGGKRELPNIQFLCRNCNIRKGKKKWPNFLKEQKEKAQWETIGPKEDETEIATDIIYRWTNKPDQPAFMSQRDKKGELTRFIREECRKYGSVSLSTIKERANLLGRPTKPSDGKAPSQASFYKSVIRPTIREGYLRLSRRRIKCDGNGYGCGQAKNMSAYDEDHIIPGQDSLQLLCHQCNIVKNDRVWDKKSDNLLRVKRR